MNHDTKCTDDSCTASCRRRTAIEEINSYLTKEFIGPWRDIPKDECLTEARHVFNIAYNAGRASAKPSVSSMEMEDIAREWSKLSEYRIAQHFYEGALWCRRELILRWDRASKTLDEYGEGK